VLVSCAASDVASIQSAVFPLGGDGVRGPAAGAFRPPAWAVQLLRAVHATPDAPTHESRHVELRFSPVALCAIANYDTVVLCHSNAADAAVAAQKQQSVRLEMSSRIRTTEASFERPLRRGK
jgi:hypothetical protein